MNHLLEGWFIQCDDRRIAGFKRPNRGCNRQRKRDVWVASLEMTIEDRSLMKEGLFAPIPNSPHSLLVGCERGDLDINGCAIDLPGLPEHFLPYFTEGVVERQEGLTGCAEGTAPAGRRIPWGRQGEGRRSSMLRNIAKGHIWQFGVTALPAFWPFWHFKLKSRVLFALDNGTAGGLAIDDARKMHRLRRTVCKGWRNKQWHGRMLAFLEMISGESAYIRLRMSMNSDILLQAEPTLAPDAFTNSAGYPLRKTQDAATVAWNLATGLYYKTQTKPPWRLGAIRPGVCYIGMIYKALPNDPEGHACCAAQMFLNEGDGVVFRGANGPWKTGDHEYHLKKDAAKKLLSLVLATYKEMHGSPPKELFIHGQTYFNDEEWNAFCKAAPSGTNVVGVRIRTTGGETKLFRDGDYPVLRGTALLLDEQTAYLWTTGYIPQLDTYIGPETPNPLHITMLRSKLGKPAIRTVLEDIMGLTKINYNSCNFNDGLPVTVRFAKMVGDVLTMGSAKGQERQPFKFYV